MRLQGKSVIVTGAAQGIGAVYARGLAAEGAKVAICDILDTQPVVDAITAGGGTILGKTVDVTDAGAVAAFFADVDAAFGGIDVLVNNAAIFGVLKPSSFMDISSEDWDRVMTVNTRGVFECCKAVVPVMRRRGSGKIINITSGTIYLGSPMMLHYVSSKGAVFALTRSLARELGSDNISVNAIAPGLTSSDMVAARSDQTSVKRAVEARMFKREEVPQDLVGTLIYLCGNDSDFVTGQAHVVDGGQALQ